MRNSRDAIACSRDKVCAAGPGRAGRSLFNLASRFGSCVCVLRALAEVTVVTAAATVAARFCAGAETAWFAVPAVLLIAAAVPMAARREGFSIKPFDLGRAKYGLAMMLRCCSVVFPAAFVGLLLLRSCGLALPLQPVPGQGRSLVAWMLYQFLYVAVAEEVFFRGYVLATFLKLQGKADSAKWLGIFISAIYFAAAHIALHGRMMSGMVLLPGMVLGWLYARSRSLSAVIVFHGLANCFYLASAAILA